MKFTNQTIATTVVAALLASSANAFQLPSRRASLPRSSSRLSALPEISIEATAIQNAVASTLSQLDSLWPVTSSTSLPTSNDIAGLIESLPLNPTIAATTALLAALPLSTALLLNAPLKNDVSPYPPGTSTYDPALAAQFYSTRPLLVLQRVLRLAFLTAKFNSALLFDWLILGKLLRDEEYTALKNNEPRRAAEALELCTQLGPTFIKLGQALSIRTDLIPEAYALELRSLQDAVPPFDSAEAREVLQAEWGRRIDDICAEISEEPVASASIGQVYRGTLKDGREVAVKVQRPGILAEIALDLHVLRVLTPIQTTLQNMANRRKTTKEDIDTAVSLVDEWGRGFVAETDYRLEAKNTVEFEEAMRKRGLDAVCAPGVVEELTRDKVLVTEWVEGTRLDRDASPDVPRLCGVAINAYLTMLLDTGVLHCDPHPGNLLRTTDGKLCILDWGMTLAVPSNLQYALLEFIAHINTEDYDSIPQDFINLGFSPADVSLERLESSGITEGLSFAFRQLSQGGGPKKIQERVKQEFQERYGSDLSDSELRLAARAEMLERMEAQLEKEGVDVKGVTNVMEEMSRRNRELFALPPYVLYVARAFSTLEGIGLSVDENYAIVQECYPYLARRLFTDRSPRAKAALRSMLGLAEDPPISEVSASGLAAVKAGVNGVTAGKKSSGLSPKKLLEMTDNFASYTAATATVDRDGQGRTAAAKEFAKLILSKEGSTLQEILVEEAAKFGDAATRSILRQALVESFLAKTVATSLKSSKEALESSEQLLGFLPVEVKRAIIDRPAIIPQLVEELLHPTAEDERLLSAAEELREILGRRLENNSLRSALAQNLSDGASIIPSALEITPALQRFVADTETRDFVLEQLPGVTTLGRRLGAGLLRRAAFRAMNSPVLPENLRSTLSDANNRLADVIDPTETKATQ
ncbi:hypothetical protein HJC23_004645 [Cyclotella cryptica]|uniref:ABC1 atypical kinase-like domain-containing protein n=1 Tax=Cyclotella cryptica TaxID=29204 RepID=A0ABD3QFK9_9STRA|eukprot:CCRYP_005983-RA/>CCRYP_005983-RA protein AED:0.02 eAED:0.02 QI:261/1/1/1/1/1/3/78/927